MWGGMNSDGSFSYQRPQPNTIPINPQTSISSTPQIPFVSGTYTPPTQFEDESSFDWHITPSERFSYESDFSKYSNDGDEIQLEQMEPILRISRLKHEEFMTIWTLVDIKNLRCLNKEQFVLFMHILNSRRKGKKLPLSIPLEHKENFLKLSKESSQRPYGGEEEESNRGPDTSELNSLETTLKSINAGVETALSQKKQLENQLIDLNTTDVELKEYARIREKISQSIGDSIVFNQDGMEDLKDLISQQEEFYIQLNDQVSKLLLIKSNLEKRREEIELQLKSSG